jgi:hypothetical protein
MHLDLMANLSANPHRPSVGDVFSIRGNSPPPKSEASAR